MSSALVALHHFGTRHAAGHVAGHVAESRLRAMLAEGTYAVFLVHPFVLWLFQSSFASILWRTYPSVRYVPAGGLEASSFVFVSYTRGEGALWGGFAYSFVLSHLLAWPLALLVRRLPGVRDVI